jgi:hypothetical protein
MTDILLLSLGCLFLYWSVKWPWQWYRSSQAKVFLHFEDDFAVHERESEDEAEAQNTKAETAEDPTSETNAAPAKDDGPPKKSSREAQAERSLRSLELMALTSCFISPVAVAYLLHAIRPYLSRPSGGLVSNSNLTLFVLAAEVRPVLHLFKLIEARTLHLQKIVRESQPLSAIDVSQNEKLDDLLQRISVLESQKQAVMLDRGNEQEPTPPSSPKKADFESTTNAVKQTIQPQLDALNRAVRRYEKRSTMQTVVLEARLRDLDNRVNDALSLAAAASRNSNRPGFLSYIAEAIFGFISGCLATLYAVCMVPWRTFVKAYIYLLGPRRKKRYPKDGGDSGSGSRAKGKAKINGKS